MKANYWLVVLTLLLGMIIFLQVSRRERIGVPPGGIREIRVTKQFSKITSIDDISPYDSVRVVYDNGRTLLVVNGEIYE